MIYLMANLNEQVSQESLEHLFKLIDEDIYNSNSSKLVQMMEERIQQPEKLD